MAKTIVVHALLLSVLSVGTSCVQSCDDDGVWAPPPEEPTCGPFELEPSLAPTAVVSLAAGSSHVCAVLDTNAIRCWGQGGFGSLGYGDSDNIGDDETPASAGDVPVGGRVIDVAAGRGHTCALLAGGTVRCWGRATEGQLGTGSRAQIGHCPTPAGTDHVPLGGEVVQLSAGGRHTCALLADGSVRCWGDGQYGQLGLGSTERVGDDEPVLAVAAVDLGEPAVQIASGYQHSCALLQSGAVRCWGRGDGGQLGLGNCIFDEQNPAACHIGDDEAPTMHMGRCMPGQCPCCDGRWRAAMAKS